MSSIPPPSLIDLFTRAYGAAPSTRAVDVRPVATDQERQTEILRDILYILRRIEEAVRSSQLEDGR